MKSLSKLLLAAALIAGPALAAAAEAPLARPLRFAKVRGAISLGAANTEEGARPTRLCEFTGEAPVYENVAGLSGHRLEPFDYSCDFTMNGKEMRAQASSMLYHSGGSNGYPELKTLKASIFVFDKADGRIYFEQSTNAGSEDLRVKSLGVSLGEAGYEGAEFPRGYRSFSLSLSATDAN